MEECKCGRHTEEEQSNKMPTIVVNIYYNDNRVNEDNSNYIDEVKMDAEE